MRLGGWPSAVKRCECYEVWERDFHRRDGSVVSEGWFSTVKRRECYEVGKRPSPRNET